jgi:hypothetical protein
VCFRAVDILCDAAVCTERVRWLQRSQLIDANSQLIDVKMDMRKQVSISIQVQEYEVLVNLLAQKCRCTCACWLMQVQAYDVLVQEYMGEIEEPAPAWPACAVPAAVVPSAHTGARPSSCSWAAPSRPIPPAAPTIPSAMGSPDISTVP